MKANWNMKAIITLNEHGKDIHEKYYRDLSQSANTELIPPCGNLRPDQVAEPLWVIAQIFGQHLYNGCKIPFETMNFELEDVLMKPVEPSHLRPLSKKETSLAACLLDDHAAHLGSQSCNDWEFPSGWSQEERQGFCQSYHDWNGDPEEFDADNPSLANFEVANFLAARLRGEA